MATTDVSITVDGLRREFGAIDAVDGVDLAIDGPEIVGLAGPNGSGKTTLIECLLGLLAPTDGATSVFGTDSRSLSADERARIGYMPQRTAVYDDLTVRENVDFFARLYGRDDRTRAVERALSFVDLGGRADDRIADLSGGMVRRASLACAVVGDPDVLVLDEPTVGLDPKLRARMWESFRQRREAGTLTLVSTHYLGEVDRCDRVCFLRDGRVLAFDTPDAFRERTGTDDLEEAFLALLDGGSEAGDGASPGTDAAQQSDGGPGADADGRGSP